MEKTVEIDKLAQALAQVQSTLSDVKIAKSATNPHFKNKFVPLSELLSSLLPVLSKAGLSVSQFPTTADGNPALTTYLLHSSGQYLCDTMPLLAAKPDPQGQGSAITYARRYALMAVLGVVGDEDDDGQAGSVRRPERPVARDELATAKERLRAAIEKAGLNPSQAQQYGWVRTATTADIPAIEDHVKALNNAATLMKANNG